MNTAALDLIINHPLFRENLAKIKQKELNRLYCRHDLEHLLAVARLGYIINLEEGLKVEPTLIYAAALLHDLGKAQDSADHAQRSGELAAVILPQCGFSGADTAQIIAAIKAHRQASDQGALAYILYKADKKSRSCFSCSAQSSCNWSDEKKNLHFWR